MSKKHFIVFTTTYIIPKASDSVQTKEIQNSYGAFGLVN